MMEYACRSTLASGTDILTTSDGVLTSTSSPLVSSTSRNTNSEHLVSTVNGSIPVSSGENLPSNDLLLALALLQGDTSSLENRGMDLTPLQKLLLHQLSTRPVMNKVGKAGPLWSGIGVSPNPAPVGHIKPLLSFLDPVTIALNTSQPKDRAGHGRRGRPLGSVGRRKLLENNQETLTTELRCELTQPATPETEARIEMIKHRLQENELRLRKLNESKNSMSRSVAGEKRDRVTANHCSVNIAPKPCDGRGGIAHNYPAVVESPCKQLKLEEKKIEPMINLVASSSYPTHTSATPQISTSYVSSAASFPESGISMVPRISLANLSPPSQRNNLLNQPPMMSTSQGSSFTSLSSTTYLPPSSSLLTPPSSSLLTPPSRLFSPLAPSLSNSLSNSLSTSPIFPSHPSLSGSSLMVPPLLPPSLNYGTGQRSLLEQIVSSITSTNQRRVEPSPLLLSRNQDTALTLLNRQKLVESRHMKCLTCCGEINPSVSIFPFMCVKCTLKKVFPE
ncbi:uncharacterized protein LOC134826573 [Bolinopsis microptera]|uniref:uncharacterized protein LOC134826573 n=1 Tax=Bolinopsis microptera TaxID=2820187 RepID=UPI00307947A0